MESSKRKVEILKWVRDGKGASHVHDKMGLFHCWGQEFTEFESGPGNTTVAIIELEDGQVKTIVPGNVKFIKEDDMSGKVIAGMLKEESMQ